MYDHQTSGSFPLIDYRDKSLHTSANGGKEAMRPDWGLIIAVISIVLIIPGGIVATILTPKVERWWATTSRRRMANRRVKLNLKLHRLEQTDLLQLAERRWRMVSVLCMSLYCIAGAQSVMQLHEIIPVTSNRLVQWFFVGATSEEHVHLVLISLYSLAAILAFRAAMGLVKANLNSSDKRLGRTKIELAKLDSLLGPAGPPGHGPVGPLGSGSLQRFIKP